MDFLATFIAIALLYLLPTIVALGGKKGNTLAIFILNFFLGWSLIGWVIALVWACTKESKN